MGGLLPRDTVGAPKSSCSRSWAYQLLILSISNFLLARTGLGQLCGYLQQKES